jgi:hypothetical protein
MNNRAVSKRTLAIVAAAGLVLSLAATVLADAPDPVLPLHAQVNGLTVTVDGSWQWPTHAGDCSLNKQIWVGFAVDWGDSQAPGNPVGSTGFDVGVLAGDANNATDNAVHGALDCGTFDAIAGFNSGTWGPISHTYAKAAKYDVCVLMYDVRLGVESQVIPASGYHSLVAGGGARNGDNSAEKNDQTPLGNGCFTTTIVVATPTPTPTPVQSVPASAEQSVKAGTGTPEQSQSNTALSQTGSSPLPTIAFSLILLASLGTLAYANVKTVRARNES